ncbi:polysaccharide lyase [Limnoraphis robusta]|uniref:polysaccharide lyase n=1 Tax=Limnoraphis robusta TaxID=1118279 RepID=UPI002B20D625|nr:polysaccharide lyase [Limnoraphis robusta]MEA5497926.1 polysaccharide lyase [Limnoraphis robusta BA-68 BA1]
MVKLASRIFFCILIILFIFYPVARSDNRNLIFVGDFESRDFSQFTDARWEHTKKKVDIVTDPVRYGQYAAKLMLDRVKHRDEINYRTDLVPTKGSGYLYQNIGHEYWYGFSTFIPENWKPDMQSELIAQFHGIEDEGESPRQPMLAIYIYRENYTIKKRWDSSANSNNTDLDTKNSRRLWSNKVIYDRGRWVDWVFHIKWSFNADGFVQIWKNDQKIVEDQGANCYNDKKGPYFRFGIYKWPWRIDEIQAPSVVTQRVVYFDEIRIGNKEANYQLVTSP